jgi:hypothetical protein
MKRRNTHRNRPANTMAFDQSNAPFKYVIVAIFAALIFALGLFFAARQHFTAMELGIKNAKLRTQLSDLENEKRRLELERAVAMSPQQLKRNARTLGFIENDMVAVRSSAPQTAMAEVVPASAADVKVAGRRPADVAKTKPEPDTLIEIKRGDQRPRQVAGAKVENAKATAGSFDARPSRIVATEKSSTVKRTAASSPSKNTDAKALAKLR